jgi:hypothetical protein
VGSLSNREGGGYVSVVVYARPSCKIHPSTYGVSYREGCVYITRDTLVPLHLCRP